MSHQINSSQSSISQVRCVRRLTSAPLLITLAVMLTLGGVAAGALMRAGSAAPADLVATRTDVRAQGKTSQYDVSQLQASLRHIQGVIAHGIPASASLQVPLSRLRLNPFRPTVVTMPGGSTAAASIDASHERDRAAALQSMQQLQLQSITPGTTHASCTINSLVYTEGDKLDAFVVEQINDSFVVLRSGVYRFELRVQR